MTYHRIIRAIQPYLALLPALSLIVLLFGSSVIYGVSQSLGYLPFIGETTLSLEAYHKVLIGPSRISREFYPSLGFTLWVSIASAVLAAFVALLLVTLLPPSRQQKSTHSTLYINLALPHLVWAIGLSLLLSQSGILARFANMFGVIDSPADFPILIRDRYGIGIILAYAGKGIPFLTLIILAILRSQPEGYHHVAQNLGATRWQRLWYVTYPLVLPGIFAGALLIFAFAFASYEVAAILGMRHPRMLAVLALDFFLNTDLRSRAEGMAISVIMAIVVLVVAGVARYLNARQQQT